ncbi:MAG: hypothetical protein HY457_00285 [Parcubacteria group bacterium]|nr:hypothetical protein [Parcubacteria group bacterium]
MFNVTRQVNTFEKRLFWSLLFSCTLIVVSYVFLVNARTFALVEYKVVKDSIDERQALLAELEKEYNTLKNTLHKDRARALGFVEPTRKVFVTERQLVGLTLGGE